jgi:hypothetical protein
MKLLLLYLFFALFLGMRAARRGSDGAEREIPAWHLLLASFVVGIAFLSQRVI